MNLLQIAREWLTNTEKLEARQVEAQRRRRYSAVFDTDDGNFVLADMCRQYNVFNEHPPLDKDGKFDPWTMAYLEGQRSVAVNLAKYVQAPLIDEPPQEKPHE